MPMDYFKAKIAKKRHWVQKKINKAKKDAQYETDKGNYGASLELISLAAKLLYDSNLYYRDKELENILKGISKKVISTSSDTANDDVVLFYDGFGLDNRGLARIYLSALCSKFNVIYVTSEKHKDKIPETLKIISNSGNTAEYIRCDGNYVDEIEVLDALIKRYKPEHFFFYSAPDDVVGTVVMNAYEGKLTRYQINLTDHAFWLGSDCIDYSIEFRNYGARISNEYRRIPADRLRIIPFYPSINKNQGFVGFPFSFDPNKQKLIFSGGALYKTIDETGTYYQILDHILSKYSDVILWYAGEGDGRYLLSLKNKFPEQLYWTHERKDLYQVMERTTFYLSTYPLAGGLMTQYAACAGTIPLTLRKEGNEVTGVLIGEDSLGIYFMKKEELYAEIDRVLCNDSYRCEKSKRLKDSVLTKQEFDKRICSFLEDKNSINPPEDLRHEDTSVFRELYLTNLRRTSVYATYAKKSRTIFKHYPVEFCMGGGGESRKENQNDSYKNAEHNEATSKEKIVFSPEKKSGDQDDEIDVSVYVCLYNSDWDKLKRTLLSILHQKRIRFEIVISDDGSKDNLFDKIRGLFERADFTDYVLLPSKINQGTVVNIHRAVGHCRGRFVRGVSDGEMMPSDTILSECYQKCIHDKNRILFGNAIYCNFGNPIKVLEVRGNPRNLWQYKRGLKKVIREDYLLNSDFICGASFFAEKELFYRYLNEIVGKVKYAEDNSYRMMMYDEIDFTYYNKNIIFYEYGTGISTSGSKVWSKRLSDDIYATNDLMFKRDAKTSFQKKYQTYLRILRRRDRKKTALYKYCNFLWSLPLKFSEKFFAAQTAKATDAELDFYYMIYKEAEAF